MDNIDDINYFIKGYDNDFDFNKFKWCYINSSIHFYLMNMHNEEYKFKIKNLINKMIKKDNYKQVK